MLKSMALIVLAASVSMLSFDWERDFETAKEKAKKQRKYILLNFSGSDWNPPCKKLRKNLLNDSLFIRYAEKRLILVNLDFPKDMKNITQEQNQKNEIVADQHNKDGEFPYTVLVDTNDNVIQRWPGLIPLTPAEFIRVLDPLITK